MRRTALPLASLAALLALAGCQVSVDNQSKRNAEEALEIGRAHV